VVGLISEQPLSLGGLDCVGRAVSDFNYIHEFTRFHQYIARVRFTIDRVADSPAG